MADFNPSELENLKVKFGYTVGSTYTWSGEDPNEIVFVQTGTDDGIIYVADKQFGISKTDYEKLQKQISDITGTDGTTIDLSGISEKLNELATKTDTTIPAAIAEAAATTLEAATSHVKSIKLNDIAFTNTEGDWTATVAATAIQLGSAITGASSGLSVNAASTVYDALNTISTRVDVLIGSTDIATTLDTIVEIVEYLETNGGTVTGIINDIKALQTVDTNLEGRIGSLEGIATSHGSSISDLQQDLSTVAGTVDNIIKADFQQDTTKYFNGLTIADDGTITVASSVLDATAVAFTGTDAGVFTTNETTVQQALIKLSESISAEQSSGVRSLSTQGLVGDLNLSSAAGDPTLHLFGTTISLGTSDVTGTPLVNFIPESSIADNLALLNVQTQSEIATINATITSFRQEVSSVIAEHLTWHYISSNGGSENTEEPENP